MLNQIQCTAAEFNAAAYNDADSIVLFLCKECAAAIDKLELPELKELVSLMRRSSNNLNQLRRQLRTPRSTMIFMTQAA